MSQPTDASRDLLFGLLALQNGLIDQERLLGAFQAWARDKGRSLAEHLVGRGDLQPEDRALLEALAARHVGRHGGVEQSLAAVTVDRAARESVATLGDPELATMVGQAGSADLPTQDGQFHGVAGYATGAAASDSQRFRVLRPHARGGLGAVFVALDGELHREVALKQILDSHADDPVSRQRFLQEAEITGGLEHPGIVPVYSLGTDAGGRPYYAMRFIRGDSLKEVIDLFHSDPARKTAGSQPPGEPGRVSAGSPSPAGSPSAAGSQPAAASQPRTRPAETRGAHASPLAFRQLLRRFLDVCNAIDYAHSRGILHRDIKPGNIIVGKHGETLVVDWGLAKPLGGVEPGGDGGERTLVPRSASGSAETLPGSAMGTPAFMSPEQAAGDLDGLGPATDVYALGATLYYLLTGRPAFEGPDIRQVLQKVQRGEFAGPRRLDPAIDKALEAVCLKAMATEPSSRYATPRALADDIEHWLADEPVTAYSERRLERLGRWLRQHRTWTYAAGAALLGISLAATIGVVVLDQARRREAVIRKEAETNFNMARKAVDDYLTSVSENTLFKLQDSVDIRKLRQELLNSALAYYKGFVQERGHDPLLRRQLADAYFRVGGITREVASPNQAIEAYREAQRIWEPLAAAHPGDHELQRRLAESYLAVGKLRDVAPNLDLDGAASSLARARAILEPLAAANPSEARYQSSLAECYAEIATVAARRQDSGASLVLLEKAEAIEKSLISRYPDQHAYQKSLAEITNILGFAYYKLGNNDLALKKFAEVQRICLTVLEQAKVGPKPLWLLSLLALGHFNIGSIHEERRDFEAALKSFEQSLEYRFALVDAHPSVTEYQQKLGWSCRRIATAQHKAHHDARAFQLMERSIDVLEALVRAQPGQAGYHSELGLSWNYLGCLFDAARRNTEALAAFERAVAEQQVAVDKGKGDEEYRGDLANHLENLGEAFVDLGRVARGLPQFRRALGLWRDQSAAHPKNRGFTLGALRILLRLGTVERADGDSAAAAQSFADARTILERQSAAAPEDVAVRILLGVALDREADALFDQGLADLARERLERALVLLRPRSDHAAAGRETAQERLWRSEMLYVLGFEPDAGEKGGLERRWRSETLWDLARVLRARNQFSEAEKADGERVALWKDCEPGDLVDLAFDQLERALVIGFGKTPVSGRAKAVRALELDEAAASVRLAIARGFNDLGKLRSHPDAAFLLARDDLKLLIMDMAFPERPFRQP
ncbi:MAG: protein kinase domain-containing protein [Isosphaeraceae bacterium]